MIPEDELVISLRARKLVAKVLDGVSFTHPILSEKASEVEQLRARLKEATALIEKIKLKVIEPTHPNWADETAARKSRFDIADWCSAFTHPEKAS